MFKENEKMDKNYTLGIDLANSAEPTSNVTGLNEYEESKREAEEWDKKITHCDFNKKNKISSCAIGLFYSL